MRNTLSILLVRAENTDVRVDIVSSLLAGQTIIVNYEDIAGADRKSIEDFISGAVFASDLHETQISDDIIIYGADVEGYTYADEAEDYE
ncbi:cell division protein SepF [Intestinibaculum porci]|uniref:cell division protein SepF n=1 Tax=Intestinibaculum porci TaxID=2487118 RepID=UPI0024090A4F|nr:cell division protein SepF [Intestinibaculum porci]MDD6349549.1 cell division protein SepF [Intestinibaculum porci]